MTSLPIILFPVFEKFANLICAFSTREGGISEKPFDSLNIGLRTGDILENVQQNRRIFFSTVDVDPDKIAWADQIHSAHVAMVRRPGVYPQTDALVFTGRDIYLTVQTADCFPVFIYSSESETIAIIHAGWRGVVNGIIENTFAKLGTNCKTDPAECSVAIGPGMQVECFEVKEDVYGKIPKRFTKPHILPGHKYLDLRALISEKILSYGVLEKNLYSSPICTKCEMSRFFSYRRDGTKSGRMMGIIGLRK